MSQTRRTFAIISHPDAGKTTLTEKLLLQGGAIHIAGEVKARGNARHAKSDWMEIERKRGISIASSVMTFEYQNVTFNLLDTPGHQDFSEDTYRILSTVDSAVMVIDGAKGIEAQTLKLFEVCRLRNIPIITFINKMDRESKDPLDLLDEIEKKLALDVAPMNWPVGMGKDFKGCYDIRTEEFLSFETRERSALWLNEQDADTREQIELLGAVGKPFNKKHYLEGHLTPVYFGSAFHDFGVKELLDALHEYAPTPQAIQASTREVKPDEPKVSGFVFKIQANMDPNHRDRIAFVRLCSGVFKRGMKLTHARSGKVFAVQAPVFFMARDRSLAEEAFPGDIIGIPNHGRLRIGDTLTEGEIFNFHGIPSFAPEILCTVRLSDPMRTKHLAKALEDLSEEGVSQLFKPLIGSNRMVGVVGQLQLDVLMSRMQTEYRIEVAFDRAPYESARWIYSEDELEIKRFVDNKKSQMVHDVHGALVFLARDSWELKTAQTNYPKIRFASMREQFT